jgi:SH3-like domain-containing protein
MRSMKISKRIGFFLVAGSFFCILILINSCDSSFSGKAQSVIDRIASRWVPDKREGICNVSAVMIKGKSLVLVGETTIPGAKKEIIDTLINRGIILIDSILILPDTIANPDYLGVVSISVINLRKQPDHRSELVSQSKLGTPVIILKNENSWLLIQTPDRYIAWTERSSVKPVNRAGMNEWKKAKKIIFLENTGWVYSSSEETEVVGDIVAGSILKTSGELNGFTKVVFPDGREGSVKSDKVMDFDSWKASVNCTEKNICDEASTLLGIPYLWGGSSSKAVDCSGFVQSVFFMNGIILSRDASLQAEHGITVDISNGYSELKRGDLLFFGSGDNLKSRVTHVAIYMGDSLYINASGRVLINSLDSIHKNFSSYRKQSLLSAKRIIGAVNDNGLMPVSRHPWY